MCVEDNSVPGFDYRPLIGYLTETIDDCISNASRQADEDTVKCPTSELERMNSAMMALENTIQIILREIESQSTKQRPANNLDWLTTVFPDNQAGRELRASFYEIHSED